ncbi:MAG: hypothetical protein QXK54_07755 [Ignisphaera sp.]
MVKWDINIWSYVASVAKIRPHSFRNIVEEGCVKSASLTIYAIELKNRYHVIL